MGMIREMYESKLTNSIFALLVYASMAQIGSCLTQTKQVIVPNPAKVEQGYVVPSKLEMSCLEADTNKPCKTIVKYDGKEFVFTYDGKTIKGLQYEIKPQQ